MRIAVAFVVAGLLASCDRSDRCGIPAYAPPKIGDQSPEVLAATDMCIAHWARTYGRLHESAGDVADATIAQCADVLRSLSFVSGYEQGSVVARQTPEQLQQSFRKDAIKAVFEYREAGCA